MKKHPIETISRGDFRVELHHLSGGSFLLKAFFSPSQQWSSWHRNYPPHAITEARLAAHYFCRTGKLLTYRAFCGLRRAGSLPVNLAN